MNRLTRILVVAAVAATFVGCTGDRGPAGPQGPTGNANVMEFDFPAFTYADGTIEMTFDFALTQDVFETSALTCYVRTTGGFWYQIPGYVTGSFQYRSYYATINTTTTRMYFNRTAGSGDQSFTNMRIMVVPASAASLVPASLDWSDYRAVAAYFGLPQD